MMWSVAAPASAQDGAPLRLVLTCQNTGCDQDFFRTELRFATFVRDVSDADVQVLITSQTNGAGGQTYTLRFLGQGPIAGRNDELSVALGATDTDDAERRAIVRALYAGLVSFAARRGGLDRFSIAYRAPAAAGMSAPARDPWNRWVFSLSARGNFDGQKRYRSRNLSYNANARRVTARWKTNVSAFANDNTNVYVLSSGAENEVTQSSLGTNALVVYSVGAQVSAGGEAGVYRSTFDNTDVSVRAAAGVEYDFFPYAQSTQRIVTLRYQVGARQVNYRDTTIYGKTEEALFEHRLLLNAEFQQPWGTMEVSGSASQYLNYLDQYSVSGHAQADVRVYRGLTFNVFGGVNLIRNQRNISGEGVSDEDIYTRRRALATGYSYSGGAGLRYTFGSALSGAVNPRYN